jgi:hypothetical protein
MLLTAGCATSHGVDPQPRADARTVLDERALSSVERLNVYEAIRRLKPTWLTGRGQSTLAEPGREAIRVYLDGMPNGDVSTLARVPVRNVGRIQFLDARTATLRFGTGHADGAILVSTRHGFP